MARILIYVNCMLYVCFFVCFLLVGGGGVKNGIS